MNVFLEILVVMGMKKHPTLKTFVMDLLQGYRRPCHILGKILTGALIENPHAVVYTESRVPPGEHVPAEMLGEELPLCEEPYDSAPEVFGHFLETGEGKINKSPLLIKASFEKDSMEMVEFAFGKVLGNSCCAGIARIPAEHIPESLVGYDHTDVYLFTGNFPVKIADHGEYHFRNFREESSVMAEEHPQGFRKSEDELSIRKT